MLYNIDFIDLKIIRECLNVKEWSEANTTWELAKRIFPAAKTRTELNKKERFIDSRLKRLKKYDLIEISKDQDNKNAYALIVDNCKLKKFNFPSGKKEGILLRLNGKWNLFQD